MFHVITTKVKKKIQEKNRKKVLSEQAERTDTSERLLAIYKTRKDRNQQVLCKQSHCCDTALLNSHCPSLKLTPGIGPPSANIALVSATDDDWWTGLQWTPRFTPTCVEHGLALVPAETNEAPILHLSQGKSFYFTPELMYGELLQRCLIKHTLSSNINNVLFWATWTNFLVHPLPIHIIKDAKNGHFWPASYEVLAHAPANVPCSSPSKCSKSSS